jgi:hypothetical protein
VLDDRADETRDRVLGGHDRGVQAALLRGFGGDGADRRLALIEFEVEIKGLKLNCRAKGERFDPQRHGPKQEIKAVTYHMLQVNADEPSVTVIFDV